MSYLRTRCVDGDCVIVSCRDEVLEPRGHLECMLSKTNVAYDTPNMTHSYQDLVVR